jgi:hypothetical protein
MAFIAAASTMCDVGQGLVVGRQPFISGAGNRQFSRRRSRSGNIRRRSSSSSSMRMYIDELHPLTAIDVSSLTAAAPAFYSATSNLLSSADPRLEVELLNDVSHVALDVTTFLSPRTAWLRLFGVIGRVLIVASDCIQDNTITLDEWAFQAVMLAVSIHLFARSAAPLVSAVFSVTALSVRDYRAYALLFQAVGLSMLQFKSLLVSSTLDWIELEPCASLDLDGDYMYFLYSGEATMSVPDGGACAVGGGGGGAEGASSDPEAPERLLASSRIIGDVQFAKALEATVYKTATAANGKSDKKPDASSAPMSRFVVGQGGASVLRISTHKLLELMKNDNELSTSIQRLVLICMQEKLSSTLRGGGLVIQSGSSSSTSTPNATRVIPASI